MKLKSTPAGYGAVAIVLHWSIALFILIALASGFAADRIGAVSGASWLFIAAYFLLTVTHTGVRVARKTYVVDMATGDQRTEYVAVSNTAMGLLLLATGAVSSALAQIGPEAALLFLASLGLLGVVAGRSLERVSHGDA